MAANRFEILDLQIKHERELRTLSETANKLALEKQASEYERRLEGLNHAHAGALADKAAFLQKAVYDTSQENFNAWKLEITKTLSAFSAEQRASQRTWSIVIILISVAISAAGLLIKLQ